MSMETQDVIKTLRHQRLYPRASLRGITKRKVAKLIDVSSCVGCKSCQVACSE
ncbi:Formate dehydrogenase-N subunit beta [Leclercia adecarboxylata]|uniref:Formate dehydrogenase-N subunit beta n=1 Tax=Leclercia adecarboxylata TaxID=83655 RepID=A0A4U9HV09_9ENTR|nr:Formate dehydrogenase-N subunit beta [Leclercia adecarboxylata]